MPEQHPFRTRVSKFDELGGVWVAHLIGCSRCSMAGDPVPIIHSIILDSPPDPAGGELEIECPCPRAGHWRLSKRNKADGHRMILAWTPELVAGMSGIGGTR